MAYGWNVCGIFLYKSPITQDLGDYTRRIDKQQHLWRKERKDVRITTPRAAFLFNVSKPVIQIINYALEKWVQQVKQTLDQILKIFLMRTIIGQQAQFK